MATKSKSKSSKSKGNGKRTNIDRSIANLAMKAIEHAARVGPAPNLYDPQEDPDVDDEAVGAWDGYKEIQSAAAVLTEKGFSVDARTREHFLYDVESLYSGSVPIGRPVRLSKERAALIQSFLNYGLITPTMAVILGKKPETPEHVQLLAKIKAYVSKSSK